MFTFIKADYWKGKGAEWLMTLCIIFTVTAITYVLLHLYHEGTDHKKLDNVQLLGIDNVLANHPDTISAKFKNSTDSVRKAALRTQRKERDWAIFNFLRNEYDGRIDEYRLTRLDNLLIGFNNKDTKAYLTDSELIITDYFWFTGSLTYVEVLFWALMGVLISLIYYISLANRQQSKEAGDVDSGAFDPAEISGQVSKMFYAPVCALVLVLGYNLLTAGNSKMTDISIGKGLLLFSFISGFFSGRVMKFLDRLKDLVLPISDDGSVTTKTDDSTTTPGVADITAELQLAIAFSQTPEGADIVEGGFNSAVVTLKPETGDAITLAAPAEDQSGGFTAKQVPFGKYTLQAAMPFKKGDTIINLAASEPVEISETSKDFQLSLDKTADAG